MALQKGQFEQLVLEQMDRLYNLARWLAKNSDDAQDLVQETILKALKARDQFQGGTTLTAWLYKILRNTFIDGYWKRQREPLGEGQGAQISEPADEHRAGVYLAVAQAALVPEVFRLAQTLRRQGVAAALDYEGRSLKAQLREADKLGCRWVAILGEAELRQRKIAVKDLEGGQQQELELDRFVDEMTQQVKSAKAPCH